MDEPKNSPTPPPPAPISKAEEAKAAEEEKLKKNQKADDDIEPAVFDAYMDSENEPATEKERVMYLQDRYENVKEAYKSLKLQKEECDSRTDNKAMNELTTAFRNNYKARKWLVKELAKAGHHVVDPFVHL